MWGVGSAAVPAGSCLIVASRLKVESDFEPATEVSANREKRVSMRDPGRPFVPVPGIVKNVEKGSTVHYDTFSGDIRARFLRLVEADGRIEAEICLLETVGVYRLGEVLRVRPGAIYPKSSQRKSSSGILSICCDYALDGYVPFGA